MLYRDGYDVPIGIQIQIDVLGELTALRGSAATQFQQRGIRILEILDFHFGSVCEVPVEERVVHCFGVGKQDNPKRTILKLRNTYPAANPAIGLNLLPQGRNDGLLDPSVLNHHTVQS